MSTIQIKICGVLSVEEANLLVESGIDFVGLNFIPGSARYLSFETARAIMDVFRNSSIKTVALFKDQPLQFVIAYTQQLAVDYVQLNGQESFGYAKMITRPILRSIAVNSSAPTTEIATYMNEFPVDYFILDRQVQGRGDMVSISHVVEAIKSQPGKIFLAGGLTPENLGHILAQVQPYGIDIAGGVRTQGALDRSKVAACVASAHQTSNP